MKRVIIFLGLCLLNYPIFAQKSAVLAIPADKNDPFWKIVVKGSRDAAQKFDVNLEIMNYSVVDVHEEINAIDIALSKPADTTIFSIHHQTPELMHALEYSSREGRLVQIINSGETAIIKAGIKGNFIGMNDYKAGIRMGQGFDNLSVDKVLVISHLPPDDLVVEARLAGLKAGMPNADVQLLDISGTTQDEAKKSILNTMQKNVALDAIVSISPNSLETIDDALGLSKGNNTPLKIATFDLSPLTAELITSDKVLFAIDQHPYLQGFYAVVDASLYADYELYPNGSIMTGPTTVYAQDIKSINQHIGITR